MADPTFSDDFDTLDLSRWLTRWHYTDPSAPGCNLPSNGELQLYVNADGPLAKSVKPWAVANSILSLTCQPNAQVGYTSGMLNTFGSFSQTYGYFEMRAKFPPGAGMWPAFWLLPADGSWPPEIDVVEWLGRQPLVRNCGTHSAVGGPNVGQGGAFPIPDGSADFHTYGVDWQADTCTFWFDDKVTTVVPTPADMHKPMYLIVNLALGGGWAGPPDASTPFPAVMQVDYIRAWMEKPTMTTTSSPTPAQPSTPTNHVVPNAWASMDLRQMAKGDTVTLGFTFDEMSILHDGTASYVWVRTGVDWTRAAILPGTVTTLG